MKILLLGKNGQVGTELRRTLLPLGVVISVGRSELNLENLSGLEQFLKQHRPNVIVNAAAYTSVDKAEDDEETAFLINEKVVKILASFAQGNNSLLVHYSTDYVFDGQKIGRYVETDVVNPQNKYGASKLAGEQAILQSGCNFLIFRTSWVFSVAGENFIKTILRLACEKKRLDVVSDQYGTPTSAELIADVTALAICSFEQGRMLSGIYHLSCTGETSWYNLACYVVDKVIEKGEVLKLTSSQDIYPISTQDYPQPAKRPKNSLLNTEFVSRTLGLYIPDWRVYVDRMLDGLYTH